MTGVFSKFRSRPMQVCRVFCCVCVRERGNAERLLDEGVPCSATEGSIAIALSCQLGGPRDVYLLL